MEIITPSRGDLLPIHNPSFPGGASGTLLPSITMSNSNATLCLPPPTASKPYPLPSRLDKARIDHSGLTGRRDAIQAWRKHVEPERKRDAPSTRNALGSVNQNIGMSVFGLSATASSSKPINRAPIRVTHTIPRPVVEQDVFMAAPPQRIPTRFTESYDNDRPKRSREPSNNSNAKRPRTEQVSAEMARVRKLEEDKWTAKWLKSFPTLVFYFDFGTEDGQGRLLKQKVIKMGATIEPFFSTKVSHLIVKGSGSPQKARPLLPSKHINTGDRYAPESGVSDLAVKAGEMGMKVWNLKKLAEIITRIAPPPELAASNSLRTLLEDERLHGTRERDLSAPRPDHYYFKPGNKYTLIEDATGKHRPIMVKEYQPNGKDGSDCPILYETFLRISSTNMTDTPVDKLRDRAWSLYVDREPFEDEQPPGELRRATSMRNISGTPRLPDAQPYHNASGNSVVITSNIASTSCANPSPFQNGLPGLGSAKDNKIMQMSKRVQVLKGNARLALAARKPPPDDVFTVQRRASTGMPPQQKTFMTQDQVVKMLRQARQPVQEEEVSAELRYANHAKVWMQGKGKEQDTAPGYCENCRLKYNNLAIHKATKKHRRFAENPQNFLELDRFISTLVRPSHPCFVETDFPACTISHSQEDDCELCDNRVESDSEEEEEELFGDEAGTEGETEGDASETEEYEDDEDESPRTCRFLV